MPHVHDGLLVLVLAVPAAAHDPPAPADGALSVTQEAEFFAPSVEKDDYFGWAGAVSHDTAVVGAPDFDVGAEFDAGAAWVWVRSESGWTQQAQLTASNGTFDDIFGSAVDIAGDTIAIGARGSEGGGLVQAGSVYIFVRNGTTWTEQAQILPKDVHEGGNFGALVALSGNTLLVGVPSDDTQGNQAGAAYVFVRTGSTWRQQAKLIPADIGVADHFGQSIDISGGTAIIGAPNENHGGPGAEGAAYVYVRAGTSWTLQSKLIGPPATITSDHFGSAVAVWRSVAVVGSPDDHVGPEGIGSAHVFRRQGAVWTYQQMLTAADPDAADRFGSAVDVHGDLVTVGAVDGDFPGFSTPTNVGEIFAFVRDGETWTQQANIFASDATKDDDFSGDISLWNDTLLSTAWLHDLGFALPNAGSAYVFRLAGNFNDLGSGLHGALGIPTLTGTGSLKPGSAGALTLTEAAPSAPAVLLVSLKQAALAVAGGTLVPFPYLVMLPMSTDHEGESALDWSAWPAGVSAGTPLFVQCAVLDGAAPAGIALSNALRVDVP